MFVILLLTSILALLIANIYQKRKSLPPGPLPLPIFGNIPQIAWLLSKHKDIVKTLKELKKTYGPVYTLWFGPQPTVHICSMELAQESMIKRGNEFADRWNPALFEQTFGPKGIIMTSGVYWQQQRRFTLHTLRNFGFGRALIEERIMMEYNLRMKELDSTMVNGKIVVESAPFFELLVGSIINRLLFSERFEKHHEKEFFDLRRALEEFNDFSIFDFFADNKWVSKIPFVKARWDKMKNASDRVKNFIRRQVNDRIKAIDSGDHPLDYENLEDYVDVFIAKIKEGTDEEHFTIDALVSNLNDLWTAGQDTTSNTLQSGFCHLLNEPEHFKEAKKELMVLTKGERQLSLQDKKNTPYLNALLTEIQRHACIVGVNLFRKALEDTTIGGHPVAQGAALAAEVSVLMNDDEHFANPEMFRPKRFLENPDLEKHVLPFGIGKRACPGESLARAELYLITGNLILDYDFEKVKPELIKDYCCDGAFFKKPEKYEMRIIKAE